jgi:hypothetical protein
MIDWESYARMSEADLAGQDVAAVNLACAAGLLGSERIDVPGCLRVLDNLSELVGRFTAHSADNFRSRPERYDHSPAKFRVTCLISGLQRHGGIRYDPTKRNAKPNDSFNLDDGFLHAAIQGAGGNCATLPVVIAAVGRRLGYPIRLATARHHMFARWDDPGSGERFNIEWGDEGWKDHPDDYYRTWPSPISFEDEREFGFLTSLSPREELSYWLGTRGLIHREHGDFRRAIAAWVLAADLDLVHGTAPRNIQLAMKEWDWRLQKVIPPGFPKLILVLRRDRPRWPSMPWRVERQIRLLEVIDDMLRQDDLERDWWGPLRAGRPPLAPMPKKMTIKWTGDPCSIRP